MHFSLLLTICLVSFYFLIFNKTYLVFVNYNTLSQITQSAHHNVIVSNAFENEKGKNKLIEIKQTQQTIIIMIIIKSNILLAGALGMCTALLTATHTRCTYSASRLYTLHTHKSQNRFIHRVHSALCLSYVCMNYGLI